MTIIGFLLFILVGAICGGIAEAVVGFSPGGFLMSVAVGFAGAWIGGAIAPRMGLPSLLAVRIEGHSIEVVWAVLGAIVLLLAMSVIRRFFSPRWVT